MTILFVRVALTALRQFDFNFGSSFESGKDKYSGFC